ncbi:PilN domain-containing protein [Shewanella marina]|uniref:PilN domain-containing protein n=1 Tax=Shewanella marina TaxID=487319 RepID=UPI0004703F8F|nr:PilN domain-containing protein [Shewanella marina]
MANINLLPWREELKEKQKRDYLGVLGLIFVLAIVVLYIGQLFINGMVERQNARNNFLTEEIQMLEVQIGEIRDIRGRKDSIEQRSKIILDLQESRNLPTHILDELAQIMPAGVYLSKVDKKGSLLWIEGHSESNNNVANFMRKVKSSIWLKDPNLQSISIKDNAEHKLQAFNLQITIVDAPKNNNLVGAK